METSAGETELKKYIFVGFFTMEGDTYMVDFRTKTIKHCIEILKGLAQKAYVDDARERDGAQSITCIYDCSIQCGDLIWDNSLAGDHLEEAFDMRKWKNA